MSILHVDGKIHLGKNWGVYYAGKEVKAKKRRLTLIPGVECLADDRAYEPEEERGKAASKRGNANFHRTRGPIDCTLILSHTEST